MHINIKILHPKNLLTFDCTGQFQNSCCTLPKFIPLKYTGNITKTAIVTLTSDFYLLINNTLHLLF